MGLHPDGGKIDLDIHIAGYVSNDQQYIGVCFIYLGAVLGELDVMTHVGAIDFASLIDKTDGSLYPITDLPSVFDQTVKSTGL